MHLRSSCTSHKCETFLSYSKLHVLACVCTTLLRCPFQCSCYCVTGCGSVSLHSAHSTARRRLDILACTKSQFSSQFLWFLSTRLLTAPVRLRGVKCFRMFPFMQPHVTTRWRSGEQLSGTNAWPIHSLHAVLFQLRVDFLLDLAVPRKLLTWSPVCAQAAGLLILANSIRRCLKKEWSPSKGWNVQTRQTGKFWEVLGRLTGLHKKSSVTAADKTKGFSLERFGFCAAFRQVGTGANLLQSLKQYQELLRLGPQNQVHFHTFSLNIDSDSCCRCQEGHNSHSRPGDCFQCLCLDISCQKLGTSEFFQHQLKV